MSDFRSEPIQPSAEPETTMIPTGQQPQGWPVDLESPRLSPADQATVEALQPATALLIVLRGPNTGARFLLDMDEVSVGRHPASDIFLDDVTVSRRHAVFVRDASGYRVRDVGSLNGTYLNRSIVEDAPLATGDEVQIGKFRLVYYASARQPQ